jgi:hypothetical protein
VSNVDYYSKAHIEKEFENSQHNSQQIVNTQKDCASSKSVESLDSKGVNEIVNTHPLLQGGEGVECASAEFAEQIRKVIANVDRSLAVQVSRALKGKIELRKEVRAALTVDEFDNFRLLVSAGFIKGTRVKYVGDPKYAEQYEGLELEVYSIDEYFQITCRKPNGAGYTTRLKPEELEVIN